MAKFDENQLVCSFCGKAQGEVKRLIAGPGVYICNECVDLCMDILEEDFENLDVDLSLAELPKPIEIKKILDEYVIGQQDAKKSLSGSI